MKRGRKIRKSISVAFISLLVVVLMGSVVPGVSPINANEGQVENIIADDLVIETTQNDVSGSPNDIVDEESPDEAQTTELSTLEIVQVKVTEEQEDKEEPEVVQLKVAEEQENKEEPEIVQLKVTEEMNDQDSVLCLVEDSSNFTENKKNRSELDVDLSAGTDPIITLPSYYFENKMNNLMSTGLQDTIEVYKTATRTTGCRTFEVTLGITGTPPEVPVDVVLVLDRSGSMAFTEEIVTYTPITRQPNTDRSYYVKVDGSYERVSYNWLSGGWSYGSFSNTRYVSWDSDGDDNVEGGDYWNPVGKPFYTRNTSQSYSRMYYAKEAAINFAGKVLGPDGISGSRVSIVSYSGPTSTSGNGNQNQARTDIGLTDNLQSVVDAINDLNAVGGTNTQAGFLQGKGVIEDPSNPNSNKVVIMFTDGLPTASNGNRYHETTDQNHVHITSAIAAGQSIWGVADVFTIGLFQGMTNDELTLARYVLNQTKNRSFYEAPSASDLDAIFSDIATQLGYSARDAVVVDEIGEHFNFVESSLPNGVTYDSSTRTITWSPGTIAELAEIKYVVRAKPSFGGGLADTNESATLTYTDVLEVPNKQKTFPVPKVDVPTLLSVTLTDTTIIKGDSISLGTETDPTGDNYMSDITGGDGNGTYTYEWRIKGSSEVFSTEKNPEVSPTSDTTYELTVRDSNGCIAIAEMKVTVIDNTPSDEPLIRVRKTFSGLTQEQINSLVDFKITITSEDGTLTKDLLLVDAISIVSNGDITYNWELEGWPAGTYIVTENGEVIIDYSVETEYLPATPNGDSGEVTTVAPTVIVDNNKIGRWTSVKAAGIYNIGTEYGEIPNLIVVKLTGNEGAFIWSEIQLSEPQRQAIISYLSANASYLSINNGTNYWYSDDSFYFRGEFKYDIDTGNLTVPESNQWSQIAFLKYDFEGGYPADITVKNTYTKLIDVTIDKIVTGNMGEFDREFDFEVIVGNESVQQFKLLHNGSKVFEDILEGTVIRFKEIVPTGYTSTIIVAGSNLIGPDDDGYYQVTAGGQDITITVTNENNKLIDTGIITDNGPIVLMLAITTLAFSLIVINYKTKKNKADWS